MFNNLLKAILNAILSEFGNDYKYYRDKTEQDFDRPCFYIKNLSSIQVQGYNQRRKKNNLIAIHYFPKSQEIKEINDICDRLYACLELINFDNHLVRGLDMQNTVSDGVLVFTVNYNFHMTTPKDKIYMNNLNQKGGIKNGKQERKS